jgi:hypothetical protein
MRGGYPDLGEDALLLEGAGDERLGLHHLPRIVVHGGPGLPAALATGEAAEQSLLAWIGTSSPLQAPPQRSGRKGKEIHNTRGTDRWASRTFLPRTGVFFDLFWNLAQRSFENYSLRSTKSNTTHLFTIE